jgi:NAD(P)H-dependent FMN reductase
MTADRPLSIIVFAASQRRGSHNLALARLAARTVGQTGAKVNLIDYGDLAVPDYNANVEHDEGIPTTALHFGELVRASDALIIASPEYNHGYPGSLKNLIDWTSRIKPQPFWGRNAMLLSASPSMVGGNRGAWALRMPLEHLGMRVYPEMFSLAQAHQALTTEGELGDAELGRRFDTTLNGFLELVEASVHYPCVKQKWIEFLGERPDPQTDRIE